MEDVCILVDRHSFPKKCGELDDLLTILDVSPGDILYFDVDSPTAFFKKALELADEYELVVPVTRNLFVRDRLRQEGVTLVVCL